jgi:DNA-binding GntR family transcriptional regulator
MATAPANTGRVLSAPKGHRTLAEKAFDALHGAILAGVLAPGERLPIEDLALKLEMSPMPIREALRRLAADGLVENIPHRGARVAELSVQDLREVYAIRLNLEVMAIRIAAERITPEEIEVATQALADLDVATRRSDEEATWQAHTAFHFALYRAADSQWLDRLIVPLWESSERYRRATVGDKRVRGRGAEHQRILDAVSVHDPDTAEAELHNHLARTANYIAANMGEGPLFPLV